MLYHVRHVQVEESEVEMAEKMADRLRKTDTAEEMCRHFIQVC